MNRHVTTLPLRALLIVVFAVALVWPGVAGTGFNVKCAS